LNMISLRFSQISNLLLMEFLHSNTHIDGIKLQGIVQYQVQSNRQHLMNGVVDTL